MAFDPNALTQGLATGMAVPNRNTGMADLVKSITNDLKTAKKERYEKATKFRETNLDIAKSLLTAKFIPSEGALENTINTGSIEGWKRRDPFDMSGLGGGGGAGAGATAGGGMLSGISGGGAVPGSMAGMMRPKGMTISGEGEPSFTYETGFSEPEAGVVSKAELLVPEIDALINLIENKDVYEGLKVPFGASRVAAFGEKGPWQAIKRGLTGGAGREAGILLQDIKVLAFGEGGKTLSENERATALALISPAYKTEKQWLKGLQQAKSLLQRKAELMTGSSFGAMSPYQQGAGNMLNPQAIAPEDQEAIMWVQQNPNNPMAAAVVDKLRSKYPGL